MAYQSWFKNLDKSKKKKVDDSVGWDKENDYNKKNRIDSIKYYSTSMSNESIISYADSNISSDTGMNIVADNSYSFITYDESSAMPSGVWEQLSTDWISISFDPVEEVKETKEWDD